jgi:tryptophan synthase alpha chain
MIAGEAQGFIYCVSSMGVTGVREEIGSDVEEMIKLVKEVRDIPCAVGFGISTAEQAVKMAKVSDGVIVGSAIVKIIERYGVDCIPHVAEYVRLMKDAIRGSLFFETA